MTRRLLLLDRLAVLLLGLSLLAAGLLLVDWHTRLLDLAYPERLRLATLDDLQSTAWWPWAFAAAGLLLGLLGLSWLMAHLRRPGPGRLRTRDSDRTGRVEVDLRSVAQAVAERLVATGPLQDARGSTRTTGSATLLEVRAHVDPAADVAALAEAAALAARDVGDAFPDERVGCRVLLDVPRRTRPARTTRVRVQ